MNLILTMAGNYSRFKNEGFKLPKFLLPWGDRSILSEILCEMREHFDNVWLIVNKNDSDFMIHVKKIMLAHNIPLENLIIISSTNSQAETALNGITKIGNIEGPIIFHNIDTILYDRDYSKIKKCVNNFDGVIDIFKSNNHNYSYVMLNGENVIEIVEKVLISDIATSGMYGFKNIDIFKKYYFNGYISEIYKKMIKDSLVVVTGDVHSESDTIVLGTPDEYLNLSKTKLL